MISRFVTLSDYCVLEFMLTPIGDTSPEIINSEFFLCDNSNVDLFQIYNNEAALNKTKNTRGYSLVPIGGSRLVRVDLTDIPIYTQYDPKIIETQVSPSLSNFLVMDTMRFHFASGFNFTEIENIVLGARHKLNNLRQIQLASILINASTAQELLTFSNRPLFLGNSIYDKYVDIKIPAVAYLDQDFEQFGQNSFAYVITGGSGFIKNSPITVSLTEATYEDYNADNGETYELYRVVGYYEGSVPQINQFDNLGAVIQEASDGDYIEFYATWNNAFPEDLISTLNAQGVDNDWIIVHQLQVYEQIGTALIPSGNVLIYQEDNFDSPLSYRPILKDAAFAVSMSIDYTIRLLNKKTGDQIIRTGSLSVFNPNKYGKALAKIQLQSGPQSLKVYNKIERKSIETSNLFTGKTAISKQTITPQVITQVKEVKIAVPTFYKQANIRISQRNALIKSQDGTTELIFGQGDLVLPIDPTDNYLKFTVYEANPKKPGEQKFANLNNNSRFTLNFGKDGSFLYNSLTDPAFSNPSVGQIAFRIPKDQARKILESNDFRFYIALIAEDGTETLLYTGTWISSSEYAAVINSETRAKNDLLNDPSTIINGLRETITNLQNENARLKNRDITLDRSLLKQLQNNKTINSLASIPASISVANLTNDSANSSQVLIDQATTPTTTRKSTSANPNTQVYVDPNDVKLPNRV